MVIGMIQDRSKSYLTVDHATDNLIIATAGIGSDFYNPNFPGVLGGVASFPVEYVGHKSRENLRHHLKRMGSWSFSSKLGSVRDAG